MVIADERFAIGILNPFKLEPGFTIEIAPIGNSVFDRGEFEKVVFAFTRANE